MAKQQAPVSSLSGFLPEGTFRRIAPFFREYTIHLTITNDRASVQGDYRHPTPQHPAHRISINGTLNPYSFLITLLHELAHMLAYVQYRNRIQPHGQEWKQIFGTLLAKYLGKGIFPEDVEAALYKSVRNVKAATCTDPELYRALKRYDPRKRHMRFVEEVPLNEHFQTSDGRVFQKIEKLRTRFRCREVHTGHLYLFPAIAEVKVV